MCDPVRLDEMVACGETWLRYFQPLRKAMNKALVPKGGDAPESQGGAAPRRVRYAILALPKGHGATHHGHYGGVLQSVCPLATEQILQINPAN